MQTDSKILSLINKSYKLYDILHNTLEQDNIFISLLKNYEKEIEKSFHLMKELNLPKLCAYCATNLPGGGCCGKEIASWYDPVLLALNLFMGIELQKESYYENSCIFLGKDGCTLRARYHFCVNYLCNHIQKRLDKPQIQMLKAQYGKELYISWQLELYVRSLLR